jgi:hypothetical protein
VGQLGRNAHGQVLKPGRVLDCYLGLLVDRAEDGRGAVVLVVAPAALLHPGVPQLDGTMLYELVTGHPDRTPGQLVFLADLTVELWAWPTDTWAKVGVDPQTAADAVIAAWHRGHPCHKQRSRTVSSGHSRSLRDGRCTGRLPVTCSVGTARHCMACKGSGSIVSPSTPAGPAGYSCKYTMTPATSSPSPPSNPNAAGTIQAKGVSTWACSGWSGR